MTFSNWFSDSKNNHLKFESAEKKIGPSSYYSKASYGDLWICPLNPFTEEIYIYNY